MRLDWSAELFLTPLRQNMGLISFIMWDNSAGFIVALMSLLYCVTSVFYNRNVE